MPPAPQRGPFAALVAAARSDAEAAEGLAAAYAALDVDARGRLLEAIRHDARSEGISAVPALAALMAVEGEPALATSIFDALAESSHRTDLEVRARATSGIGGTDDDGHAFFARPLYGEFMDLVYVSWTSESIERARFIPLLHAAHLEATVAGMRGDGAPVVVCSEAIARDRIVEVLWRHRCRHGSLPQGTEAIARAL